MLVKHIVSDGGLSRQVGNGDNIACGDTIPATIATNAITITGSQLSGRFVQRTTTGAGTDTIDTAANIISALIAGLGSVGVANGTAWWVTWIQNAAFAITLTATANTGITVTSGVVNASSVKDFLVTVTNGTPAQSYPGMTTNASAVVTGFTADQLKNITTGMVVTNAVNGLQGTTVIGVNIGAGSVTFSGNANATSSTPVAINFSPTITLTGIGQGLL
jgi:hypothetical protein